MADETLALAFQGVFDRAVDIAADLERITADIGAPTYRAYSGAAELAGPAAQLLAAAEKAGQRPLGASQSHWLEVVAALRKDERYEDWASIGSTLDLAAATEPAVATTRPHR